MSKRVFQVRASNPKRGNVISAISVECQRRADAGEDFDVTVSEPKRTLDSNACMWATLADIAKQVEWPHTNGKGEWSIALMSADAWKTVLTAGFEQEVKMAQGIGGGNVMLGARTSQYSRRKMGDLLEFVHAFGSERGVKWSARASDELAEFR
jgi:hypothetical protein